MSHRNLFVAIVLLALGDASIGQTIINGDFENAVQGWNVLGTATLAASSNARSGQNAMRVTARGSSTDGPRQDLQALLTSTGSGAPLVVRYWISSDAAASSRAMLLLTDDSGTRRLVLAEKVIRQSGMWTEVSGVATPSWVGTPTVATLYFDVSQPVEKIYPDYYLDDVSIALDRDGDGLSDADEGALGTDPTRSDSDSDRMADAWEVRYGFDPLAADGSSDADGDGFSNFEEYSAATHPRDAASYPGRPANAKLSGDAHAVLKMLALLPSRGEVIPCQHVLDSAGGSNMDFDYNVGALATQTGRWPGMLEFQYDGIPPAQFQVAETNRLALDYWYQGGLVAIKWNPYVPWGNAFYGDAAAIALVDIPGMLARNSAANEAAYQNWIGQLDTVAAGLAELQERNVVVLWRWMAEMNGSWFWWGRRSQADYVALWRFGYDYLTRVKQLNNLIWVFESDSGVHDAMPSDYYYPGDDVVDVMGHNYYDDDWQLSSDLNGLYRTYGKVYAFPQAGPEAPNGILIKSRNGWDNRIYLSGIRSRHPRASYFCAWNTFTGNTGTVYHAIVDQANAAAVMTDPSSLTRETINWRGTISDRLFGWVEALHPQRFAKGPVTASVGGYSARIYDNGNALGTKDGQVFVYGSEFGGLVNLGAITTWMPLAVSAGY